MRVIEEKRLQRRLFWADWSQRRRWTIAALVMIAFLCASLGVAVPAVLLVDFTVRQGDPPATPTEAADLYLVHLDQGDEIGLRRALADGRRDELVDQWRQLKLTIERTDPAPDKLEWSSFDVEDRGQDRSAVAVPVQAVWWEERGMSMVGTEHPWRFSMRREDGGWRITDVEPYAWCGGHVRADACQ
jgi:hypothetical protein